MTPLMSEILIKERTVSSEYARSSWKGCLANVRVTVSPKTIKSEGVLIKAETGVAREMA